MTDDRSARAVVELDVHDDDAGQRADRYLRKLLPQAPLALIHRLLRTGALRDGKRRLRAATLIEPGSRLTLALAPLRFDELRAERSRVSRSTARSSASAKRVPAPPLVVRIVHEDDALLVLDKPGGLAVQPGTALGDQHLVAWLAAHFEGRRDESSMWKPAPAHRIDKATSGLVLVGATASAARALATAFRERRIQKTYLAIVHGAPTPQNGTIELGLDIEDRGARAQKARIDVDGMCARSRYRTMRRCGAVTLLEVDLDTGRTHQIRAHLAAIGHPLVGDVRYGAAPDSRLPRGRIALHAAALELTHPTRGTPLRLRAPLPRELERLLSN